MKMTIQPYFCRFPNSLVLVEAGQEPPAEAEEAYGPLELNKAVTWSEAEPQPRLDLRAAVDGIRARGFHFANGEPPHASVTTSGTRN